MRVTGLSLLFLFLAAFIVLYATVNPPADFEAAGTRLEAEGFVTTAAEWNRSPKDPAENGAHEIHEADAMLIAACGPMSTWTAAGPWRNDLEWPWWEHASEEDLQALDRMLEAAHPALDRCAAAVERPYLRWAISADFLASSGEVPHLQHLLQVLEAQAVRGPSPADRLQAVRTRLLAARRAEGTTLITSMVLMAGAAGAVQDVRYLVVTGALSGAEVRERLDGDLVFDASGRLPELVRAEIVAMSELQRRLYSGRMKDERGQPMVPILTNSPKSRLLAWVFGGPGDGLEALARAAEVNESSFADRMRAYRRIDDSSGKFPRMFVCVWPQMATKCARLDAALRLARIALAVKAQRETAGAGPASIDAIVDAFPDGVPLDPFTDAPFEYDVRAGDVRIASAGRLPTDAPVSPGELDEQGLAWVFPR